MNKRCNELVEKCKDYLSAYDNEELSQALQIVEDLEARRGDASYRFNEVLDLDELYTELMAEGRGDDYTPHVEGGEDNYTPPYGLIRRVGGRWGSSKDSYKMTFPMIGECVRYFTGLEK